MQPESKGWVDYLSEVITRDGPIPVSVSEISALFFSIGSIGIGKQKKLPILWYRQSAKYQQFGLMISPIMTHDIANICIKRHLKI